MSKTILILKRILAIIYLTYTWAVLIFMFVLLLLLAIFGGTVDIVINWHSWGDLIKHFKVP